MLRFFFCVLVSGMLLCFVLSVVVLLCAELVLWSCANPTLCVMQCFKLVYLLCHSAPLCCILPQCCVILLCYFLGGRGVAFVILR